MRLPPMSALRFACARLFIVLVLSELFAPAAHAAYRVELDAPRALKGLLTEFLDLFRYKDRDDIDTEQLNFMVATVAEQVTQLTSTEGYFSPVTKVKVDQDDDVTVVRLTVEAGPQTKVSKVAVDVTGPAVERSPEQVEQLHDKWSLNEGDSFRQDDWAKSKQDALQVLQQRRYAAARLASSEARILADSQQAELAATYDSGPVFTLGPVHVNGMKRYPASIIDNVNPLRVGEEYNADRLLEFQRQILRTPYFSNVVVDIDKNPASASLAPVNVQVTEFPTQRVRGGVGYSTDTGAHLEGRYSHNNMFDRAWVLDSQIRLEQRRQNGSLALSMPPDHDAFVNSVQGSFDRTTLSGVELRSRQFGVHRSRNTDKRDVVYSIDYYSDELQQINGATVPSDTIVLPGTHQALVAGMSKTRRQVDNPVFPRKGRVITLQVGAALKGLLTDQTFIRGYGRIREYVPVGRRDVVLMRAELGAVVTKGGNAAVPASLLFRAGGTDSVRGYAFQSIGNVSDGTVYPTRYLATGSAEYQHWLTDQWGGAVFYDVGTATDNWPDKELFHSVGVGARWRSPVGSINADLAYGIQDKRIRPHLSLGVAF